MTDMQFTPAKKHAAKLRFGISAPTGAGKTYTALAIATALGQKVAVIDTEHGSASLYADRFQFDTLNLASHHPQNYIDAINAAAQAGYDVCVVDSLTHAWAGKDGALEQVDKARARSQSNNSFVAWKDVTPLQNRLVETILGAPMHMIVTMRSKTEYIIETVNGRQVPRKIGMAPVQRDGIEYEFTVFGEMNAEHQLIVTKSRLAELADQVIEKPGAPLAAQLLAWLDGDDSPPPAPVHAPAQSRPEPRGGTQKAVGEGPATDNQNRAMFAAYKHLSEGAQFEAYKYLGESYPKCIVENDGVPHFGRLTMKQASDVISYLNARRNGTAVGA